MDDLGFSAEDLAIINSGDCNQAKNSKDYYEPFLEEISDLSGYTVEAKTRYQQARLKEIHKRKMRYLNKLAMRSVQPEKKSLVSKVEKIQKFIKKIKTLSEDSAESILQEMESLNLNRYISELAGAISENKMQLKELPLLVECCSNLHQRYLGFAKAIEEVLKKQHKESDLSRKRAILRFITELIVYGLWEDTKGYLRVINNYVIVK